MPRAPYTDVPLSCDPRAALLAGHGWATVAAETSSPLGNPNVITQTEGPVGRLSS